MVLILVMVVLRKIAVSEIWGKNGADFGDFYGDDRGDRVNGWMASHDEATQHQANCQGTRKRNFYFRVL